MLTFADDLRANPLPAFAGDAKVNQTAVFLNDMIPRTERAACCRAMMLTIAEDACVPRWREMATLDASLWVATGPQNYRAAAEAADKISMLYLADHAPFSRSMQAYCGAALRIPHTQLFLFGRTYCAAVGLTPQY